MSMVMFGEAAAACAGKCPPHAIGVLAGAVVISFLIGFFAGRRGRGAVKKVQPQSQKRREVRRERDARQAEPRQPIPAGSVEIYVGNLSYDLTEEHLRKTFEAFGTVASVRIVTYGFNDKSKGFGFVVMPNRSEADAAIAAMSEKEVLGRKMRVNESRNTIKKEA